MRYEPIWGEHFDSIEERDEHLIKVWNERVSPKDTIYHLGDVSIPRKGLKQIDRLNGRKILIKGNHDIFKMDDYYPRFADIRSYKMLPKHGIICSHIPVHSGQLAYRFKWNIHGHTHGNIVMKKVSQGRPLGLGEAPTKDEGTIIDGETTNTYTYDLQYINVCVEHLPNFGPISFDELLKEIEERSEAMV